MQGDNEQKERKFLQKAFQCTECNNGYVYASSLKTHYEKCHKDFVPATNMDKERENSSCQNSSNSSTDKQSILDKKQCPFCNKLLKERRSAVQHYRIKHSIYHCSKCFFEVKNKIRAKIHWLKFHRKFKRPEYLKNVRFIVKFKFIIKLIFVFFIFWLRSKQKAPMFARLLIQWTIQSI